MSIVVFLVVSLRNTDGTVIQGANSGTSISWSKSDGKIRTLINTNDTYICRLPQMKTQTPSFGRKAKNVHFLFEFV
jgi:hypothetical protein